MTRGSAYLSSEEYSKGAILPGKFADLAVLSKDYFTVPEEEIRSIQSVLTVLSMEKSSTALKSLPNYHLLFRKLYHRGHRFYFMERNRAVADIVFVIQDKHYIHQYWDC